jgi:DNA polymerase
MMRLELEGFPIVFDVHDEVVIEANSGNALDRVVEIMSQPIAWAPGLPLNAEGWVDMYFKKD